MSVLITKLQLAVMYALALLKHTDLQCYVDFVSDFAYILQDARLERVAGLVVHTAIVPCLNSSFFQNTQWPADRSFTGRQGGRAILKDMLAS